MLLRQKKTQGEEQNWCVILSPITNELDRKKVAQKISDIFSLSYEESLDVVSNTPIIILDNLTRPIAIKLKEYFRAAGAETVLTNDVFHKRKCYRTVWPEQPNLSFLHNWNPLVGEPKSQEALPPDEALDEIRHLSKEEPKTPLPSLTSLPFMARTQQDHAVEEMERWKRECLKLQEEVEELKSQLEKSQQKSFQDHQETSWDEEKEKDAQEAKILLDHAQQKYETLRQEYASARHLYEEKIMTLQNQLDQIKHQTAAEQNNFRQDLEYKLNLSSQEIEKIKRSYHDALDKASFLESQNEFKLKDLQEKIDLFKKTKEEMEISINSQAEQITYWHSRYESLVPKVAALEKQLADENLLRQSAEFHRQELDQNYNRLVQSFEEKSKQLRDLELRAAEMEKQIGELQDAYQSQETFLHNQMRQLELREKELETARRQLREVNTQLEQRETAQKRIQLANQLIEKEAALKQLVLEQEKIVTEIKGREEAMRAILSQQENIEKEILEAKQAQRHLAELAKRDQKSKFRISAHPEEPEIDSELPADA